MKLVCLAVPVLIFSAGAFAHGPHSEVVSTPQWEKLKGLVGVWDGYTQDDKGQKNKSHLEIRMTGDGSAIMHWMDANTPHEMLTMFTPDGKDLVATHYCAAHNQPRFRLAPSKDPNQLTFEFKDGTNIAAGEGHMSKVVVTFTDATHHHEEWTYTGMPPMTFFYTKALGSKEPAKG